MISYFPRLNDRINAQTTSMAAAVAAVQEKSVGDGSGGGVVVVYKPRVGCIFGTIAWGNREGGLYVHLKAGSLCGKEKLVVDWVRF